LPLDASAHAWGWLTVSGLIGFVVGDYCLFRAFVEIGPRLSSLLMTSTPVWAALIGLLVLGETMTSEQLVAMTIVVSGIAWAVNDRHPADARPRPRPKGVAFALLGSIGQAAGLILSKLGMGDYDPFAATQIRVFAGILGFAAVCTFAGWWPKVGAALRDKGAMKATLIGAVFGPFLGVSLSLISVQRATNAGVAATLMSVTPILLIPAVMIRGERVGLGGILGTLLAVAGSALFFL
ncbi:MAG: DMT family transporter, partial [Nannocystaceae bacterium]